MLINLDVKFTQKTRRPNPTLELGGPWVKPFWPVKKIHTCSFCSKCIVDPASIQNIPVCSTAKAQPKCFWITIEMLINLQVKFIRKREVRIPRWSWIALCCSPVRHGPITNALTKYSPQRVLRKQRKTENLHINAYRQWRHSMGWHSTVNPNLRNYRIKVSLPARLVIILFQGNEIKLKREVILITSQEKYL